MGIAQRILDLFKDFNWVIIPVALFAIIFHELSHGFVSYLLGDRTAKDSGRLSLNPINHIDLLGLICMILFGFGWAKPVPVNVYHFKNKKLGISLVSLAGPLSNIIMAIVSMVLFLLLPETSTGKEILDYIFLILGNFFIYSSVLNVGLAVFNLLPIPPLDGSKILFSLLPRSAYGFILKYERYGMLVLIILINLPFFSDFLTMIRQYLYVGLANIVNSIFF